VAAVEGSAPAAKPAPTLPMLPSQTAPVSVQMASLQSAPAPLPPVTADDSQPMPEPVAEQPLAAANNVQLVGDIQRGLASLGFYHGAIDGHPGDSTARAIREFENFYRYEVTGQVKPDLVILLRDAGATI